MLLTVAALTACQAAPEPSPAPTPPASIEFDPDGGAAGNTEFFAKVLSDAASDGVVTELELQKTMQKHFPDWPVETTPDHTTLEGTLADFHQVAVRGPDQACLIGQIDLDGHVASHLAKPLTATGKCLIGDTTEDG